MATLESRMAAVLARYRTRLEAARLDGRAKVSIPAALYHDTVSVLEAFETARK